MGKILVIAEKPSVANDIAKVLKCKSKGEGFLYNDDYIISWAIGHLVTLFEPEDYDKILKKWNIDNLPFIPDNIRLKAINKTKSQLNVLKKLMNDKNTEYIICATDSGREGELIFRYIYEIVRCKKKFKRLWISSMTDEAIREGFNNLKDGSDYNNLYYSARCRSEADWLVGINATRAFTVKYNTLLSIGRVQTPTLAIIVSRQKEIDNFVPEDYFEVECDYGIFKGLWFNYPNDNETKIKNKKDAETIVQNVEKIHKSIIYDINIEKNKKAHPLLFDLTELQRECNKKYGFSAKKTLDIAQSLYEKRKVITYPRTDSRYLSDDMKSNIINILDNINNITDYSNYIIFAKNNIKNCYNKRVFDNSKINDHTAIIPTNKKFDINKFTNEELKVFDLIVLRFISIFYNNYLYDTIKVYSKSDNEHFISKGNKIIDKGWTVLYEKFKLKDDIEAILTSVNKNDILEINKCLVLDKKTTPPKYYTEATILSAMENAGKFVENEELKEELKESGIGTPATRAIIIEKLIKVGYIKRDKKNLLPTEKAIKLIDILPKELKSPETTGKWEKGLNLIAKGKMNSNRFMSSIERYVDFIVNDAKNINNDIVFEKENNIKNNKKFVNFGICPFCGKRIFENTKAFYCEDWKNNCKFTIWKNSFEIYGVKISKKIIKDLLRNNKVNNINVILPQTGEKGKGDIILKILNNSVILEIKNFKII